MKKEISNELKEEMSNLFETEERVYNNVIDLGSNIVAFTSLNDTGADLFFKKQNSICCLSCTYSCCAQVLSARDSQQFRFKAIIMFDFDYVVEYLLKTPDSLRHHEANRLVKMLPAYEAKRFITMFISKIKDSTIEVSLREVKATMLEPKSITLL